MLKKIWNGWKKFGFWLGDIISSVILVVFYFTVFALVAIPFRLFSDPLARKHSHSKWILKKETPTLLVGFRDEF